MNKKILYTILTLLSVLTFISCAKETTEQHSTEPTVTLLGDEATYGNKYNISIMELTDEQREQLNKDILAQAEETAPQITIKPTEEKRISELKGFESSTKIYNASEMQTINVPQFEIEEDNLVYIDNWDSLIDSGLSPDGIYYIKYCIIDYFTHFLGKGIYHVNYVDNSYVNDSSFPWFYLSTELNSKTINIRCIYNVANKCYYFECMEIGDMVPS